MDEVGTAVLAEQAGVLRYAVKVVSVEDIELVGVANAVWGARVSLFRELRMYQPKARVVCDGEGRFPPGEREDCWMVPKADSFVPAVMLAANIAKHLRDEFMRLRDAEHPQYGFATNVGYGTAEHMEALRVHGPCVLHRVGFRPVREALGYRTRGLSPVEMAKRAGVRRRRMVTKAKALMAFEVLHRPKRPPG